MRKYTAIKYAATTGNRNQLASELLEIRITIIEEKVFSNFEFCKSIMKIKIEETVSKQDKYIL